MGQEDYMLLPSIKKLANMHKSATLEVIPDCGHVLMLISQVFLMKKL